MKAKVESYNGLTNDSVFLFVPIPVFSLYIPYSTKNIRIEIAWLCFAIVIWIEHDK